jgi:very-short-patch-repair endonuclease
MPLKLPPESTRLLHIQSGVLSRGQALELGLTRDDIWNLLRTYRWQRLQRSVYATCTGPPSRTAQLWAVVLRAAQHPAQIPGALIHRSRSIERARHPAFLPPRTRIEDTVLDLWQAAADPDQAFDWVCRAVSRRLTTTGHLASALSARSRIRSRPDLLVALSDVAGGVISVLERLYVTGVERRHGLPTARRQVLTKMGGQTRYVDNLYDAARLAVELDGRVAHPPEQRRADARRDIEHACSGILTVRYSWADLKVRPCQVAVQVAELLRMRGTEVNVRRCGPGCVAGG